MLFVPGPLGGLGPARPILHPLIHASLSVTIVPDTVAENYGRGIPRRIVTPGLTVNLSPLNYSVIFILLQYTTFRVTQKHFRDHAVKMR